MNAYSKPDTPSTQRARHYLYAVLLPIFAVINVHHAQADVGAVNIYMRATIVSNTCTVSTDSVNKTINMGTWARKQFVEASAPSPLVNFTINLEKCGPAVAGVAVTFSGTSDGNGQLFKLSSASTATGVGVAILDKARNRILPGQKSMVYPLTANAASAVLQFYAQYVATGSGSAVGAGTANADATFTMEYS